MNSKILLIEGESSLRWVVIVRQVVSRLGKALDAINTFDIRCLGSRLDYELIILDANAANNLPEAITQIRSHLTNARIVVFSSAPGWKEAKEVMLAGAIDYERKSLNEEQILSILRRNLSKIPFQSDNES